MKNLKKVLSWVSQTAREKEEELDIEGREMIIWALAEYEDLLKMKDLLSFWVESVSTDDCELVGKTNRLLGKYAVNKDLAAYLERKIAND